LRQYEGPANAGPSASQPADAGLGAVA